MFPRFNNRAFIKPGPIVERGDVKLARESPRVCKTRRNVFVLRIAESNLKHVYMTFSKSIVYFENDDPEARIAFLVAVVYGKRVYTLEAEVARHGQHPCVVQFFWVMSVSC